MPLFAAFCALFKALMLIDALRRGGCCNNQWYFIIVLVPFGEWVYFFVVKVNDPEFAGLRRRLFTRPVSLAEIRGQYAHCQSIANRHQLARALFDAQLYGEAKEHLQALYQADPTNQKVGLELSMTLRHMSESAEAFTILEKLKTTAGALKDHAVAEELIETLWDMGKHDEAIAQCKELAQHSKNFTHKVRLARLLAQANHVSEANSTLREIVSEYDNAPRFVKRLERQSVREARKLLASLKKYECA